MQKRYMKNTNNNKEIEWHAVGWMKNSSLVITKFVLITWLSIKTIGFFFVNNEIVDAINCGYLVKNKRKEK